MKIETNMSAAFAAELAALFDKYGVVGANGWDDGSLILYLANSPTPPFDGPDFWVEFPNTD